MIGQSDTARRLAIYQGLQARNRVVAILRIAVPVLGLVALAILLGQIYLSSLGTRFSIAQITVSPDGVSVEAPEYAGLLENGTAYHVSAVSARAATDATDQIDLREATLAMTRPDGVVTNVVAAAAVLDTTRQWVIIKDEAQISTSEGTHGIVANSVFDYASQSLRGEGPVTIDYADGTDLVAEGMTYDAIALVWTFTRATVTLPDTPGAAAQTPSGTTEMPTP